MSHQRTTCPPPARRNVVGRCRVGRQCVVGWGVGWAASCGKPEGQLLRLLLIWVVRIQGACRGKRPFAVPRVCFFVPPGVCDQNARPPHGVQWHAERCRVRLQRRSSARTGRGIVVRGEVSRQNRRREEGVSACGERSGDGKKEVASRFAVYSVSTPRCGGVV